jgi:hypothetical protein
MTEPVAFPAQPPFPVLSGSAPDAIRNNLYSPFNYTISSGQPPYSVTLVAGSLPPGLSISSAGQVTGTPTALGIYPFTLRVTDSLGLWTEYQDNIGISVQVVAVGALTGVTNGVTRRGASGSWTTVNTGTVGGNDMIIGLSSGRFVSWIAGAAYYSDDNGTTWTQSASTIDSAGGARRGDSLGAVVTLGGSSMYVSTDSGTTYIARTMPNSFLGNPVIVKSGPSAGRILLSNSNGASNGSYSDNQGVSFTNAPPSGVGLASGVSTFSVDDLQFIGGNATSKPAIAVFRNGNTLVRNLTLTGAANGYTSALCRYTVNGISRLFMGTSTGELWKSEDDGVTATKVTSYASTGRVSGIVYDGVRLIVSKIGAGSVVQSSLNNGGTWVTETTTSASGVRGMAGTQ